MAASIDEKMFRCHSTYLTVIFIAIALFLMYCTKYLIDSDLESLPVLVWWTGHAFPFASDVNLITCQSGKCLVTTSRSKLELYAHNRPVMIIFYGTDFNENDLPSRKPRREQLWALLHEESPMNNYIFSHLPAIELFNYTATFRRESDFPLTTIYLPDLEYLTERKPVHLSVKNQLRQHLAPIVYVQSNCDVPSDRDSYVFELSKHIAVDSYGKCLHNKDLPSSLSSHENFNDDEFLNFISKYKFCLAYENALCNDYMTEKLFRSLHVGSVPIYKGSPRVLDWTPTPNSIILVDDFSSAKDLASFIHLLDSNNTLYEEFLNYKLPKFEVTNDNLVWHLQNRKWSVNSEDVNFVESFQCFLCDQLIEKHSDKDYKDLKMANNSHFGCPPPSDISTSSDRAKDPVTTWTQIYWQSLERAKTMRSRIEQDLNKESFAKNRDQL